MPENQNTIYRQHLVLADQKAIEDFDKTIITLASGALAVSLAFMKDIVGADPVHWRICLQIAWLLLTLSLGLVLISFWCSHKALRRALADFDADCSDDPLFGKKVVVDKRNAWAVATQRLNVIGMTCLILGIGFMLTFASVNLGGHREPIVCKERACKSDEEPTARPVEGPESTVEPAPKADGASQARGGRKDDSGYGATEGLSTAPATTKKDTLVQAK